MKTAQLFKSIASVVVLGVFLITGFMLDLLNMYNLKISVGSDASEVNKIVANAIYILAVGVVMIWNIDYENVDLTIWAFVRPAIALCAYLVAYCFEALTFIGTPIWVFPSLFWIFKFLAPSILILDLVLGVWIYMKKS